MLFKWNIRYLQWHVRLVVRICLLESACSAELKPKRTHFQNTFIAKILITIFRDVNTEDTLYFWLMVIVKDTICYSNFTALYSGLFVRKNSFTAVVLFVAKGLNPSRCELLWKRVRLSLRYVRRFERGQIQIYGELSSRRPESRR